MKIFPFIIFMIFAYAKRSNKKKEKKKMKSKFNHHPIFLYVNENHPLSSIAPISSLYFVALYCIVLYWLVGFYLFCCIYNKSRIITIFKIEIYTK